MPEYKASMGQAKPQAHIQIIKPSQCDLSLRIPAVVGRTLGADREHSSASIASLQHEIEELSYTEALKRIMQLSANRERSEKELSARLLRDGFSHTSVARALERAIELRVVSNQRFASAFVRSKLASGWAIKRIERELATHNLSLDELVGWPEDFIQEEDETARALAAAQKRSLSSRLNEQSTMRFLASRGFSYSVAHSAAKQIAHQARKEAQ